MRPASDLHDIQLSDSDINMKSDLWTPDSTLKGTL